VSELEYLKGAQKQSHYAPQCHLNNKKAQLTQREARDSLGI